MRVEFDERLKMNAVWHGGGYRGLETLGSGVHPTVQVEFGNLALCLESDVMSRERDFGRLSAAVELDSTRQYRCDQTQSIGTRRVVNNVTRMRLR